MPKRWTPAEETAKRAELEDLYVRQNLTIGKIAARISLTEGSVYDRLVRLGIPITPERKLHYLNRRNDIRIPLSYSEDLAEFVGILLGDGHVAPTQIIITVNQDEQPYAMHVSKLIEQLFHVTPHRAKKTHHHVDDLYVGSVDLVRYFLAMGLVPDKVRAQVDVPTWIITEPLYAIRFLRGFFDTDGSIYKLRYGVQLSYKNASQPLLATTKHLLNQFGYHPSSISAKAVYLTRRGELSQFFSKIAPKNQKHIDRARRFGIIR